jgi:hypothetical protein
LHKRGIAGLSPSRGQANKTRLDEDGGTKGSSLPFLWSLPHGWLYKPRASLLLVFSDPRELRRVENERLTLVKIRFLQMAVYLDNVQFYKHPCEHSSQKPHSALPSNNYQITFVTSPGNHLGRSHKKAGPTFQHGSRPERATAITRYRGPTDLVLEHKDGTTKSQGTP